MAEGVSSDALRDLMMPQAAIAAPAPEGGGLPAFDIPGMGQSGDIGRLLQTLAPRLAPQPKAPAPRAAAPVIAPAATLAPPAASQGQPMLAPAVTATDRLAAIGAPPVPVYRDPLATLGNPLTALALIASAFTRTPATTAMNALAGAMTAQRKGDIEDYTAKYRQYEQQLQKVHADQQEEQRAYQLDLQNRRLALQERYANMRRTATKRGDTAMLSFLDAGGNPSDLLQRRAAAGKPISEALIKTQTMREMMAADPNLTLAQASAQYDKEKADAKKGPKPPTMAAEQAQAVEDLMLANPGMTRAEAIQRVKASGGGTIGDFSKEGAEFLDSLPPNVRDTVQAIAEGRQAVPSGRWGEALREAAFHLNPALRGQEFSKRQAGERYFASGKGADAATTLNQMMGHSANLMRSAAALQNTGWRTANKALMAYGRETNDPAVGRFLTDIHVLRDEASRVFKGTATEGEIKRSADLIDGASSYEYLQAQLQEFVSLIESRLDALQHQYERSTGRTGESADLLSPHARAAKDLIERGGPAPGTVMDGYRFKGGNPSDKSNWEPVQ